MSIEFSFQLKIDKVPASTPNTYNSSMEQSVAGYNDVKSFGSLGTKNLFQIKSSVAVIFAVLCYIVGVSTYFQMQLMSLYSIDTLRCCSIIIHK